MVSVMVWDIRAVYEETWHRRRCTEGANKSQQGAPRSRRLSGYSNALYARASPLLSATLRMQCPTPMLSIRHTTCVFQERQALHTPRRAVASALRAHQHQVAALRVPQQLNNNVRVLSRSLECLSGWNCLARILNSAGGIGTRHVHERCPHVPVLICSCVEVGAHFNIA